MSSTTTLPAGTLDNARALFAAVSAASTRHPQDPRLASAVGHAAALVALLAHEDLDPNPPHPHLPADGGT